jgi:hypothetical protein
MTSLLAGPVSSTEMQVLAIHIARLIFDFGCMGSSFWRGQVAGPQGS